MKKADISDNLKLAIATLEVKQKEDLNAIRSDLKEAYENLKPINVIKNTISGLRQSPDLLHGLTNTAIGSTIGFLVKKIFFRQSKSPLRNLAGNAIESIASRLATRYSGPIVGMVQHLLLKVLSKAG